MTPVNMSKIEELVKKHKDGVTIDLFIKPDSKKNMFPVGFDEWRNCVEMNVKSSAQDNKANMDVLKTISGYFKTPLSNVLLVAGAKKREKTVLIKDANVNNLSKKLEASLDGL